MKKLIALVLLACALVVAGVGCSGKDDTKRASGGLGGVTSGPKPQ